VNRHLPFRIYNMSTKKEQATYSHGHHSSVVNDHARRGASDSAGFLIPHIKPDSTILDVGCGPGSITIELAALVPQGRIVGLDFVGSVLTQARETAAAKGLKNIEFQELDANALPFEDGAFDIVFCHQVLHHVADPSGILREMRRVSKRLVAAREADYGSFAWYPEIPLLERWRALYTGVSRANGGEPNAGRRLPFWARDAGIKDNEIELSWDAWRYTGERAKQFSESHGGRILQPGFVGKAVQEKLASEEEIKEVSKAWLEWGLHEDALIIIPSGQLLCWKH
jgi:SAM-dependent methyltransferase